MAQERCEFSEMTADDYEDAYALWKSCDGILLSDADSREKILAYLERNPGLSYVARSDGRLVGAVLCGHDGRRGFLYHLAVDPAFQNKGIGRRLADVCLVKLSRIGISRCNIFVVTDNEEGEQFWKNGGWYDWPTIKLMSKETEDHPTQTPTLDWENHNGIDRR